MSNNKKFLLFFLFVIAFVLIYIVEAMQEQGDVVGYRNAYESISGLNLFDAYKLYVAILGGAEPVSFLLTKLFSELLPRSIFASLSGAFLLSLMARFFLLKGKRFMLFIYLVPLNFYFLVICLSAERLKFGFIFLFISLVLTKTWWAWIFRFLSVFSHFQMVVFLFARDGCKVAWRNFGAKLVNNWFSGGLVVLGLVVVIVKLNLFGYVGSKLEFYNENNKSGLAGFLGVIVFYLLTIARVRKDRWWIFLEFFTYFVLIYFIGKDRINLLCYISYVSYAVFRLKRIPPELYVIALYFNVKGCIALLDISNGLAGF